MVGSGGQALHMAVDTFIYIRGSSSSRNGSSLGKGSLVRVSESTTKLGTRLQIDARSRFSIFFNRVKFC
jgi:ribosome-associated protein YbcJ (S4-like RNA binding protein)